MIHLALRYAERSDNAKFRHVAIVKRGRRILAIGWNTGWRHAEHDAIGKVRNREYLKGATITSYRVNRKGELRNAKPCPRCDELIRAVGIERVIYSDENGDEMEYEIEAN
jgi:deoxycytidylate deaminase